MDELLDWAEVSERTRVPVPTLRTWRALGKGPQGFRIGKHVRFRASDVSAWLEAQYVAAGGRDAAA